VKFSPCGPTHVCGCSCSWNEYTIAATALLHTHVTLELFTELLAYPVHGKVPAAAAAATQAAGSASSTGGASGPATAAKPVLSTELTPGETRQRGHAFGYFLLKAIKSCKLRFMCSRAANCSPAESHTQ
jgi:hypothetical protein